MLDTRRDPQYYRPRSSVQETEGVNDAARNLTGVTWSRLDDAMLDNGKIERVGPIGFALHVAAIVYCGRNLTDGFVPFGRARILLGTAWARPLADGTCRIVMLATFEDAVKSEGPAVIEAAIDDLVREGLWHTRPDGYDIHDYLKYNPSREQVETEREATRGRVSALRSRRNASSNAVTTPRVTPSPVPVPLTDSKEVSLELTDPSVPEGRDDVADVFATWLRSTGRQKALLDEKRRRLIRNAIKTHGKETVLKAVQGWKNSPHHRGENDRHTVYNDLELILRDSKHIEQFADLHDRPALSVVPEETSVDRWLRERQARDQEEPV